MEFLATSCQREGTAGVQIDGAKNVDNHDDLAAKAVNPRLAWYWPGSCVCEYKSFFSCFFLSLRTTESGFNLPLLTLSQGGKIFPGTVVCSADLVERIVGVLLKLLSDLVDLLLPPEALLVLHLFQSSLFIDGVGGLETPFGMLVDLLAGCSSQGEGVESIVDAGSVEGSKRGLGRRRVQSGKVKAARLLLSRLCIAGLLAGE